jgi:predicted amidophosphoribosyltransferase
VRRYSKALRRLVRRAGEVSAFLLPANCFGCGRPLGRAHRSGGCLSCWASLVPCSGRACASCAVPLPGSPSGARCLSCAIAPPPFARAVAAVVYRDFARAVVLRAKEGRRTELIRIMGEQLATAVSRAGVGHGRDVVIPVPGRPVARLVRGFDHAALLAAHLGSRLQIPMCRDLLRSSYFALRPLKGLSAEARRDAVRGRVVARRGVAGLRVLLLDDVMTSGATLRASAQALASAGALSVEVAVWARTPAPGFDRYRGRPV